MAGFRARTTPTCEGQGEVVDARVRVCVCWSGGVIFSCGRG
jgi:hypothetical protein